MVKINLIVVVLALLLVLPLISAETFGYGSTPNAGNVTIYTNNTYINQTVNTSNFVPYTGATSNINLNEKNISNVENIEINDTIKIANNGTASLTIRTTQFGSTFTTDTGNGTGSILYFQPAGGETRFYRSGVNTFLSGYNSSGNAVIRLDTRGDSYFNGGDVGIGITNPVVPLAVSGSIRTYSTANATNYMTFTHSGDEGTINTNWGPFSFQPASGLVYVYKSGVDSLFRVYNKTGSIRLSLNSNGDSYFNGGNVGIGTTNPRAELDVFGTSIFGTNSSSNATFDEQGRLKLPSQTKGTTNEAALTIGNVSGTKNGYGAQINMEGGIAMQKNSDTSTIYLFSVWDRRGSNIGRAYMDGNSTNAASLVLADYSLGGSLRLAVTNQSIGATARNAVSIGWDAIQFWNSTSETQSPSMTIRRNSGLVGINTNSPEGRLHVVSGSALADTTLLERTGLTSDIAYTSLRATSTKTTDMADGFGSLVSFAIQDNSSTVNTIGSIGAVRAGTDTTGDIVFQPFTSGTANTRMIIKYDGDVGIGTSTPTKKLDVNGSIKQNNGNATINNFYGGMWMHNDTGLSGTFNSTYQKLAFFNSNNDNGFIFHSNNSLQLVNNDAVGLYQAIYKLEGEGTNNHEYHSYVYINEVQQNNTIGHAIGEASNSVKMNGLGMIRIAFNDNITVRVADLSGGSTGTQIDANINLVRIGN